ncbi:MAG: DUF5686 and carboxypeptidase regulatory-like domain-containing protein [Prevotella sp.]|nr:DUF5686 and carboxypeptidase regulatory-like domain-containing protein [Prevotella sp.]MCM1075105.1 DUF5686 and carboxypeptidase regulatory-like domain-containing protein [Ruminococcus sp.]
MFIASLINWHTDLYASNQAATTIKGIVVDSISGEALPYASIYIKGTSSGIATDINGKFSFSTTEKFNGLRISVVGYNTKDIPIKRGQFNNLQIRLSPSETVLQEIVVNPKKQKYSKKNNPAVQLMERIRETSPKYCPKNHDFFNYDKYEKIVLALNDFNPATQGDWFTKKFVFLQEYVDTSEISGKTILPLSVKEKASKILYRKRGNKQKEYITGFRRGGLDQVMDQESMQRFLEDVFREIDIFQNDVTIMQNKFVSPLSNIAANYYKFYLDTVPLPGEKCLELSFAPHNPESFGFNGRMYIPLADSTLFIKKIVMRVPAAINLNYVKNIYIVQNYEQAEDGTRMKVSDDMTVELQILPGTPGFYARRQTAHTNHTFAAPSDPQIAEYLDKEGHTFTDIHAALQPEQFWHDNRQIPIKENEDAMKKLLARLRQVPAFYWFEKVVKVLVSGYIPTRETDSKFDLGPMNTTISANTAEGARFRVGGMTTANLSKHWFSRGYVAYGTRDRKFKYGAELEYSFNEKKYHSREFPIHSLLLNHTYDLDQLGQHYLFTNADNIFLSLKRKPDDKITYRRKTTLNYKMERPGGFSFDIGFKHEIQEPTRWLPFENGYGDVFKHYSQSAFSISLRFAPGETFYQTKTHRIPINMDAWVVQLSHEYGPKGMLGAAFTTNKTELSIQKRFWFSAFGYTDVLIKGGKIWSQVQYPALCWPNANLSYTIQPESYPLMNAMEFANDQYVSWDLTYWANGALLNRLPLIKYLRLREVVSFRGLYGSLSDKNNPSLNNNLYRFPFDAFTAPMGSKPYMELGVGIDNILTILRVDYVWRLTYRDTPNVDKSGVRVQLHFTF